MAKCAILILHPTIYLIVETALIAAIKLQELVIFRIRYKLGKEYE